jgi:hypothetical protein
MAGSRQKLAESQIEAGVSYRQLAENLEALGIYETERNIANKISRGGFSATFFVQCLVAAGCNTLHLEDA